MSFFKCSIMSSDVQNPSKLKKLVHSNQQSLRTVMAFGSEATLEYQIECNAGWQVVNG